MLQKQMKYFVSIVEHNSFSEAAEELFISQSAISQQMKALEEELGVLLMRRENRKFTLTPAGDYFYRQCKGILAEIEDVKQETVRIGQDKELQLRIGYLAGYHGDAFRLAVEKFSEIYPEVYLGIEEGNHEEIFEQMRDGSLDMVLNDQRRAFSDEYENIEMVKMPSFIEISNKNPLSQKEKVDVSELKQIPCIIVASKDQQVHEREYYQTAIGFTGNFLFASSMEAAKLMVIAGRGFLSNDGNMQIGGYSGVKRIPLYHGEQQMKRNYCVFYKKKNSNYYMEEFAAILKEKFENMPVS